MTHTTSAASCAIRVCALFLLAATTSCVAAGTTGTSTRTASAGRKQSRDATTDEKRPDTDAPDDEVPSTQDLVARSEITIAPDEWQRVLDKMKKVREYHPGRGTRGGGAPEIHFESEQCNLHRESRTGETFDSWERVSFEKDHGEGAVFSIAMAAVDALHVDGEDTKTWHKYLDHVFGVDTSLHWLILKAVRRNWDAHEFAPENYYLYADPLLVVLYGITFESAVMFLLLAPIVGTALGFLFFTLSARIHHIRRSKRGRAKSRQEGERAMRA